MKPNTLKIIFMHYFKNNITVSILSNFESSLSPEGNFSNEKIEAVKCVVLVHLSMFKKNCYFLFKLSVESVYFNWVA